MIPRVITLTDDIIRLNRKEKQFKGRRANVSRRPFVKKGRLNPVSQKTAGQRGECVNHLNKWTGTFTPVVHNQVLTSRWGRGHAQKQKVSSSSEPTAGSGGQDWTGSPEDACPPKTNWNPEQTSREPGEASRELD